MRGRGGKALLLPQIRPLGDLDEGEPPFEPGELTLDLPAAISPWRRRFELAALAAKLEPALAAGQALEMADALGGLIDSLQIEEIEPLERIETLVEGELARHWMESGALLRDVLAAAGEAFVGSARTSKRWTSSLISPCTAAASMMLMGSAFQAATGALDLHGTYGEDLVLLLAMALLGLVLALVSDPGGWSLPAGPGGIVGLLGEGALRALAGRLPEAGQVWATLAGGLLALVGGLAVALARTSERVGTGLRADSSRWTQPSPCTQFSINNPGTRSNSRVLFVTSVTPSAWACAAIRPGRRPTVSTASGTSCAGSSWPTTSSPPSMHSGGRWWRSIRRRWWPACGHGRRPRR